VTLDFGDKDRILGRLDATLNRDRILPYSVWNSGEGVNCERFASVFCKWCLKEGRTVPIEPAPLIAPPPVPIAADAYTLDNLADLVGQDRTGDVDAIGEAFYSGLDGGAGLAAIVAPADPPFTVDDLEGSLRSPPHSPPRSPPKPTTSATADRSPLATRTVNDWRD
jgi:hypothetical protein